MRQVTNKQWTAVANQPPARQGFYAVRLTDGTETIGEWRKNASKDASLRWHTWVSSDPTVAKHQAPLEDVAAFRPVAAADVQAFLSRQSTEAERIEAAYAQYSRDRNVTPGRPDPVPACRTLALGDSVELGNLRQVTVAGCYEEGRVLVLRHRRFVREYGRERDAGWDYMARPWYDVIPAATIKATQLVSAPLILSYSTTSLDGLLAKLGTWGVNENPDYQRGYVWTADDRERFLDAVLAGRELGRFVFVNNPYPQRGDILDGKQRLLTLWGFVTSQFQHRGYWWHELSKRDRAEVEGRLVQYVELSSDRFSRAQLLQVFLEVNAGGVPQTEAHLARIRQLLAEAEAAERLAGQPTATL